MPEKKVWKTLYYGIYASLWVGKNGGLEAPIKINKFKMCACSALIIIDS
jgi:hypothetical protein